MNLTKTRYPKFLDKPELYGTHWEKLDDIPKLKREVYDQAMINKASYYYTRTFQLERDLAEAKQQLAGLTTANSQMQRRVQDLKCQAETSASRAEKLRSSLEETSSKLETSQSNVENLKAQLRDEHQTLVEAQNKLAEAKTCAISRAQSAMPPESLP